MRHIILKKEELEVLEYFQQNSPNSTVRKRSQSRSNRYLIFPLQIREIFCLVPRNSRCLPPFQDIHFARKNTKKRSLYYTTLRYRTFAVGAYFEKQNHKLVLKIALSKK